MWGRSYKAVVWTGGEKPIGKTITPGQAIRLMRTSLSCRRFCKVCRPHSSAAHHRALWAIC